MFEAHGSVDLLVSSQVNSSNHSVGEFYSLSLRNKLLSDSPLVFYSLSCTNLPLSHRPLGLANMVTTQGRK